MTKSIISTFLAISILFSTTDAMLALWAAAGKATLSAEDTARFDMDGDGVITTNDVLMILREIAGVRAAEPCFEPLSAEAELKLLEAWAVAGMYPADILFNAESLMIYHYYGTFNGREVVIIYPKNAPMTMDMQYIDIAGHRIALGSGSLRLLVHDNGRFVPIHEAYERGWLTADDIKLIANPPSRRPQPQKAPSLEVNAGRESVQALQLTTSWFFLNEDGTGGGYEADSPHALQLPLSEFDRASVALAAVNNEMILLFSDNLQPDSIIVRRWRAEHGGRSDVSDVLNISEAVSIKDNVISVANDGQSYIYEVEASWEQGRSRYTFRVAGG
jgi:hypothetical protein